MSGGTGDVPHYCGDGPASTLDGVTDPALEITGLTVRYGGPSTAHGPSATTAVDALDLCIPRGETVALLGPNGAGKSTTVNAVLGLVPHTGDVRVLGRAPEVAVRAGDVGAMLQHGGLPGEARVGEVLDLVRRSFPRSWPLADLVVTTGIEGLLRRSVEDLSGGQRQRVLLALALAGRPPLLLLDEPTSAMDVEGRRAFWTTMRGLAEGGTTVVFATHHLDEADAAADRVVVVPPPRLVADGTAAAVKAGITGSTISFTADPGDRFDGLPGVTGAVRRGTTVELSTGDPEETLRALLAGGRRLPGLQVRGASLEEAVLTLTDGVLGR
jgi:ABC-2 type transport system ATP-binding protein